MMRNFINIVNEAVEHNGTYSKLSKNEFIALAEKHDLRGIGYDNEVFVMDAFEGDHHSIRSWNGVPLLFGEFGEDHDPHGFDFYVTTKDRAASADEDWSGTPSFEVGDILITTTCETTEEALSNREFAYLVK